MTLYYAGIGSRDTPQAVADKMTELGTRLANNWTLRSGFSGPADLAFGLGAEQGSGAMEMYLPWLGFNGAPSPSEDARFKYVEPTEDWLKFAANHHPAWDRCDKDARAMHVRNSLIVMGPDRLNKDTRSKMIVCWTPNGQPTGGTSQAMRIGLYNNVPCFNLALPKDIPLLKEFIERHEP